MIKNYFKTAWRNLGKSKLHSFINIAGLSIGMAVAMLIGLWMYDEISFNRNFKNHDRIAQVIQNVTNNGEVQTWTTVPYPLADELRKNYGSDFKRVVMAVNIGTHTLEFNEKKLSQQGGYFEKGAVEMFTLKMLRGDRNGLEDHSSLFLSASAAKAFFGDENPVNKIMKIDDFPPVKVSGVYEDFARSSLFADLNFICSWDFLFNNNEDMRTMEDPWRPNFAMLFVELNDNADFNKVSARIKNAKLKKVNPQLAKKKPALFLQPMDRMHLYSEFKNGVNTGGDIQYVWMFGIIGVFVLLLACINFMNLSTARSERRAKEVGIRKAIGSLRKQIILQFFSESLVTVFFAFVLSLLLAWLTLPFFSQVSGKQMSILWTSPLLWLMSFVFTIVTALIAGSYPALYLSSFKPIKVLKGSFKAGRYAAIPRKALVVLQFTVSVTLIIGTVIIYKQIQFAKNRPVGYTREGLINIAATGPIHDHFDAIKEELVKKGAITFMAESGSPTTAIWNSSSGFSWPGKDPGLSTDFGVVNASYDYGKTIGWNIKEGRDFSKDFLTDSSAIILNEAAVRYMNLKNPIGKTMTWWDKPFTVIGVIHDMVMRSPYEEGSPVIYSLMTHQSNVNILKINPAVSTKAALAAIEAVFKKFNPEQPFDYQFVDEDYAKKFNNEERIGKLASFFAILAIAISCLGLFGLTSFVAEQRKKEMGIRKVLGASVLNVWNLLSKEFILLVIISVFISIPISYYFTHRWLQNYNYRTELAWWIFPVAGICLLAITFFTISFQAIRAAIANPVKSLRTE